MSTLYRTIWNAVTALLFAWIFLAWAVSGALLLRWLSDAGPLALGAAVAGWVILGAGLRIAWVVPEARGDIRFLAAVSAMLALVRVALWVSAPGYAQAGDCRFMFDAIRLLAEQGWGDDTMLRLAAIYYDDYLWAGRSLPFLYPAAVLFPGHEVALARGMNLLWSLLVNVMAFAIARPLFGRRAARIAFVCVSLIPIHTWMTLDYTHQFFGAVLVVLAVLLLSRVMRMPALSRSAIVLHGLGLGAALCLLHLQSGIDLFVVVITCAAVALAWLAVRRMRGPVAGVLAVALVAALVYVPFSAFYKAWSARYQHARMSSHPISFTARGWNLATLGEYYGVYEQIDRETPAPLKHEAMAGLILSQMAHQPFETLVKLPLAKIGKYFLVGYATGIKGQLEEAGETRLATVFDATRYAFTPVFLLLALVGLWRMIGAPDPEHPARLLPATAVALFCSIYLVAGETSPRYSFHIQALLAVLAGCSGWAVREEGWKRRAGPLVMWPAILLTGLIAAAFVAPPLIRHNASPQLFADFRAVQADDGSPVAPDKTVFTAVLASLEADATEAGQSIRVTVPPDRPAASLFFWPLADAYRHPGGQVEIRCAGERVWQENIERLRHVNRVAFSLPDTPAGHPVEVHISFRSTAPLPSGAELARWGYLKFDADPAAAQEHD